MILVFFYASVILSCLPFLQSTTDPNGSMPICPESFSCPNLTPFRYPFYNVTDTRCGLIKVNCTRNGGEIQLGEHSYEIRGNLGINATILLVYNETFESLVNATDCKALMDNFTSPSPQLYSISIQPFITLYKCKNNPNSTAETEKYFDQTNYYRYQRCNDHNFRFPSCGRCHLEGRQCPTLKGQFQCLNARKEAEEKPKGKLKQILVPAGSAFILILFIIIFVIWRRYKTNPLSYFSSKDKSPIIEDGSIFFGVSVFSYTELEDATKNFDPSQELGNGGFGAVYYGKLQDGREVAVKRLYEHNYKRVQQFMNEVKILTRLHHPNLVVLYGCTSRQSHELLLVYEYISNGTVADHLHGELANPSLLTWPLRMNIAIETARALVYLHASEIIHRDVKTSNILLDQNFSAKVADFGLSRLLPNDMTHVSTAPQGTPGYVDPQYHNHYQLTDKSDVYSFGVVLIELVSSLVAVDLKRSQDEISLANLALNKIQRCALDQLIDPDLGSDSDAETMRMITSVAELAFQCLQYNSEMRPTMNEVLDVLEDIQAGGRIDADDSIGELGNVKPPAPSETSDKTVLLKDFLISPVSITSEWHSESTVSTTLSVR